MRAISCCDRGEVRGGGVIMHAENGGSFPCTTPIHACTVASAFSFSRGSLDISPLACCRGPLLVCPEKEELFGAWKRQSWRLRGLNQDGPPVSKRGGGGGAPYIKCQKGGGERKKCLGGHRPQPRSRPAAPPHTWPEGREDGKREEIEQLCLHELIGVDGRS